MSFRVNPFVLAKPFPEIARSIKCEESETRRFSRDGSRDLGYDDIHDPVWMWNDHLGATGQREKHQKCERFACR